MHVTVPSTAAPITDSEISAINYWCLLVSTSHIYTTLCWCRPDRSRGTPGLLYNGIRPFSRVKGPECGSHHQSPSIAWLRMFWIYKAASLLCLYKHVMGLIIYVTLREVVMQSAEKVQQGNGAEYLVTN